MRPDGGADRPPVAPMDVLDQDPAAAVLEHRRGVPRHDRAAPGVRVVPHLVDDARAGLEAHAGNATALRRRRRATEPRSMRPRGPAGREGNGRVGVASRPCPPHGPAGCAETPTGCRRTTPRPKANAARSTRSAAASSARCLPSAPWRRLPVSSDASGVSCRSTRRPRSTRRAVATAPGPSRRGHSPGGTTARGIAGPKGREKHAALPRPAPMPRTDPRGR